MLKEGSVCCAEATECAKVTRQESRHRVEELKDVQGGCVVGWADIQRTIAEQETGEGETHSLHANLRKPQKRCRKATTDQIADTD